jgi:uncharacterized protein YlxW (UPF0749 family)
MNPTAGNIRNKWLTSLSISCLLLGLLATWAYKVEVNNRRTGSGRQVANNPILQSQEKLNRDLNTEVRDLRQKLSQIEQASTSRSDTESVLKSEIKTTKVFAGLVDVEGPGVTVVLQDSPHPPSHVTPQALEPYLIHDVDILKVTNELRASGAEEIAVNGHRLTARSAIRCVGPVVQVDRSAVSSPFRIQAIGNKETLASAMNMAGGVLYDLRQQDPKMVQVIPEDNIRIPSYGGPTQTVYTKVPETLKK